MGGKPSSSVEGRKILRSEEVMNLVVDINLTQKEVKGFLNLFYRIDLDKGGTISLKEFYAHFGIEKTAFADRAFAVLDEDASGELDYHEFLAGVWSMCSSSKRDLVSFLFSLFDEDKSNSLDDAELESSMRMLHNSDPLPHDIQEQFDEMVSMQRRKELLIDPDDDPGEIVINIDDFVSYLDTFPKLMQPAIDLRDIMRKRVNGEKYWIKKEKKRQEQFEGLDLDSILFSRKREKAKEDKRIKLQKLKDLKVKENQLKAIRKRKKKEAYEKAVQEKWEKATPEETEYRESCKAVSRAKIVWEEAKKDGASKAECVALRRRLQQAEQDCDEAWKALEARWSLEEEAEKKRRRALVEKKIQRQYQTRKGKKIIEKDAKMMKWTFRLLPQVAPIFELFDKIALKECKQRVLDEFINSAVKAEMKKIKKMFKRIRKDELKFVKKEVLKDPWEDGPWDEESTASESSDHESVFLDDDDWILHISVQNCHFQSVDCREWHNIMGTVPNRILHAAGIRLEYRRRNIEEIVGSNIESKLQQPLQQQQKLLLEKY
jgi:serine/threonine-protein phosphatase 2B regulatory subunit